MNQFDLLTDEQWERVEPLLPSTVGKRSRPFRNHRQVLDGIIYRYRTGCAWREVPRSVFGPWQTLWKRHDRFSRDGTWDRIRQQVLAEADGVGQTSDRHMSVDVTTDWGGQRSGAATREGIVEKVSHARLSATAGDWPASKLIAAPGDRRRTDR